MTGLTGTGRFWWHFRPAPVKVHPAFAPAAGNSFQASLSRSASRAQAAGAQCLYTVDLHSQRPIVTQFSQLLIRFNCFIKLHRTICSTIEYNVISPKQIICLRLVDDVIKASWCVLIITLVSRESSILVCVLFQGIIHRDIKGQNILCDSHGRCKLADFGASRYLQVSMLAYHCYQYCSST